jgi:hypothetical protein
MDSAPFNCSVVKKTIVRGVRESLFINILLLASDAITQKK